MARPNPSSALSKLRVLDLSRVRAGPTCVRIFADFGADVIKIESPPGVDPNENMSGPRHGYDMQNLHRNKRSLTLNLKTAEGKEILRRRGAIATATVRPPGPVLTREDVGEIDRLLARLDREVPRLHT